jgi:hypothetical protein
MATDDRVGAPRITQESGGVETQRSQTCGEQRGPRHLGGHRDALVITLNIGGS